MAQTLARPVAQLIDALARLPGIGPKTASRLTFYLLRDQEGLAAALAEALLAPMLDPAVAAAQRAGFAESLAKLRAPEGLPSEAAAQAVLAVLAGAEPAAAG